MSEQLAKTDNLLHPRQVSELKEEKARLDGMLRAPEYIRSQLQDNGANATRRIRDIDKVLEQAPPPIPADQIDEAVRTEAALRAEWTAGMPTAAEMRRNAAGSVDKHIAWEKRNKDNVLKWKHLRRRMHASGLSDHKLVEENDVSNIEMFRPVGGSQELNMHNEQIPGKDFYFPDKITPVAVMNSDDDAFLKKHDPELHSAMALMDNDSRAKVLDLIHQIRNAPLEATPKPKKAKAKKAKVDGRRNISPEERIRRSEHMKMIHAEKKRKREAEAQASAPLAREG